jgi:hypothetical protein
MARKPANAPKPSNPARTYLSQEDVPAYSLEQTIRVPRAIADSYAYRPTRPLNVAGAMRMSPSSGSFRTLAGAAIAYGLTSGGAFASEIAITPLGMRIVRPTLEGDDLAARREALLIPKVLGEFLRQYDGAALPADTIASNVLVEKGVPAARVLDVLALIVDGAASVGFIRDINGKRYVDLASTPSPQPTGEGDAASPPMIASPALPSLVTQPSPGEVTRATVAPTIQINIEIHIAADTPAETIEEIFKNMRRYVLGGSTVPEIQ